MSETQAPPETVRCPACRSDVSLDLETTCVTVCTRCLSVLERSSVGLRAIGVSGRLRDHGSKLYTGLRFRHKRAYLNVMGRTQPEDGSGNRWDEWYAEQDDGTWAWIAEDQGRYFLTQPLADAPEVPPLDTLQPGDRVRLQGVDFTVDERDEGRIRAAEGQIPFFFRLDETYTFVDLSAPGGRFATLDGSHDPPRVYLGQELSSADFVFPHVGDPTSRPPPPTGEKTAVEAKCGKCTKSIQIRVPAETVRVFCPACGQGHDVDAGTVTLARGVGRDPANRTPLLAFGKQGVLEGEKVTVVGWMRRSVKVEGVFYPWDEYLLAVDGGGFRWLVVNRGHLTVGRPVPAGEVSPVGDEVEIGGASFERFSRGQPVVDLALGEFNWRVNPGESSFAQDWVRAPYAISREQQGTEANWVLSKHLETAAFEAAFPGVRAPSAEGVGMTEPFRHGFALRVSLIGALVALGLFIFQQVTADRREVAQVSAQVDSEATEAEPLTVFGPEFELEGGEPITVQVASDVTQTWVFANGAVAGVESGLVQPFAIEVSRYSGVESGESWSEGSPYATATFSALPAGKYTVQFAFMRGPAPPMAAPTSVTARIIEGDPGLGWPILVFCLLGIVPIVLLILRAAHERRRFEHSDFPKVSEDDS